MTVTQAVIAAGGKGSKMMPMSEVLAKEMLPVREKPILHHLVDELRAAGIARVLFVISRDKTNIAQYFGSGTDVGMEFAYRVQDPGDGPGAPVLMAETWGNGADFVYAFGDNLITAAAGRPSALHRLLAEHTAHPGSWHLLADIRPQRGLPSTETVLGPLADWSGTRDPFDYTREALDEPAPQLVACAARWVFTSTIFAAQRACPRRSTGELYLVDAVQQAVRAGLPLRVSPLTDTDRRYNIDTWPVYHSCVADLAGPEMTLVTGGHQ